MFACLRSMPNITCKHYGVCGGCALLNLPYGEQVAKKLAKLQETLKDFWTADIPVTVTDNPLYFRNKVELGFCHQVKWREDYDKKIRPTKPALWNLKTPSDSNTKAVGIAPWILPSACCLTIN